VFKLSSKQKRNLITTGVVISVLVPAMSFSDNAPPNPPGFDWSDAYIVAWIGVGLVMILLGLFAPTQDDDQ